MLVMPLIEGTMLGVLIPLQKPGAQKTFAENISRQLFDALLHMHSHDVCHLDVYPENIMVSKDGLVTLIDLGCASKGGSGVRHVNLEYAPPETAEMKLVHKQNVRGTEEQDCWAAGIVAAEMMAGNFARNISSAKGPVAVSDPVYGFFLTLLDRLRPGLASLLAPSPAERLPMLEASALVNRPKESERVAQLPRHVDDAPSRSQRTLASPGGGPEVGRQAAEVQLVESTVDIGRFMQELKALPSNGQLDRTGATYSGRRALARAGGEDARYPQTAAGASTSSAGGSTSGSIAVSAGRAQRAAPSPIGAVRVRSSQRSTGQVIRERRLAAHASHVNSLSLPLASTRVVGARRASVVSVLAKSAQPMQRPAGAQPAREAIVKDL